MIEQTREQEHAAEAAALLFGRALCTPHPDGSLTIAAHACGATYTTTIEGAPAMRDTTIDTHALPLRFSSEAYETAVNVLNSLPEYTITINGDDYALYGAGQPDDADEVGVFVRAWDDDDGKATGPRQFIPWSDIDAAGIYVH